MHETHSYLAVEDCVEIMQRFFSWRAVLKHDLYSLDPLDPNLIAADCSQIKFDAAQVCRVKCPDPSQSDLHEEFVEIFLQCDIFIVVDFAICFENCS